MKRLLDLLNAEGFNMVSLSVPKENYANKIYRNLGFKVNSKEFVMCLLL